MGWIETKIREIKTGRLGIIVAEVPRFRGTDFTVKWDDGSKSVVIRHYWATTSDYEIWMDGKGGNYPPFWRNLGE